MYLAVAYKTLTAKSMMMIGGYPGVLERLCARSEPEQYGYGQGANGAQFRAVAHVTMPCIELEPDFLNNRV